MMKKLLLILTCLLALPAVSAMANPVSATEPESQVAASSKEDNLQRLQRDLQGKRHCRLVYTTVDKRYALVAAGVRKYQPVPANLWAAPLASKSSEAFVALYSVELATYKSSLVGLINDIMMEGDTSYLFEIVQPKSLTLASSQSYAFSFEYSTGATTSVKAVGRVDMPNSLYCHWGRNTPKIAPDGKSYTCIFDFEQPNLGNVTASDGYPYMPEHTYDFSGRRLRTQYVLSACTYNPFRKTNVLLPDKIFRAKREVIEDYILSNYGERLSKKLPLDQATGKYKTKGLVELMKANDDMIIVHLERVEEKDNELYLYADGGRVILKEDSMFYPIGIEGLRESLALNPKGMDILVVYWGENDKESEFVGSDGTVILDKASVIYITGRKSQGVIAARNPHTRAPLLAGG